MFSYLKVLCVTTITKNIPKKKFKERDMFFVSIQTVAGSGYYGIECLYCIIRNLTTRLFLVAWMLEVKTKWLTMV